MCQERPETSSCAWFFANVETAPFRQRNFDALLVPLGRLYSMWRQQQPGDSLARGTQQSARGTQQAALPTSSEGNSQAFFISADQVVKAKVAILKMLQPMATETKAKTTSNTRDTSKFRTILGQPHTHVYLDSAQGDQYKERYKRLVDVGAASTSGAVLLRFRLGQPPEGEAGVQGDPADPARVVEIDVQSSQGHSEVVSLPQKAMRAFLSGDAVGDAAKQAAAAIKQGQLRPAVSACLTRSSFGAEEDAGKVSSELLSVDERIMFRDEAAPASAKAWARWGFAVNEPDAASAASAASKAFSGAVLHVWLPPKETTTLLDSLGLTSIGLDPMPGFSEALHATALLHGELAVPVPPWMKKFRTSGGHRRQKSSLLDQPADAPAPGSPPKEPAERAPAPGSPPKEPAEKKVGEKKEAKKPDAPKEGPKKPEDPPLKIDCKTPMAIERTLLRWMRSTVMLASLSALLLSGTTFAMQVNGALIGLVSILFVILPARDFIRRSKVLSDPKAKQPKVDRAVIGILSWSLSAILLATVMVSFGDTSLSG